MKKNGTMKKKLHHNKSDGWAARLKKKKNIFTKLPDEMT